MPLAVQAAETSLTELSDQLNRCIDQQFADASTAVIFAQINLSEECPQLAEKLAGHSELTSTLSLDQDSINLAELADLRYFVVHMRHPGPGRVQLELSDLQGILDNALRDIPQEPQSSWWKQFIDWLFRHKPGENEDIDFSWLENLLGKLMPSASVARIILYASAFLIAALALAMIWHEVRLGKAAGWSLFRRRFAKNARAENLSGLANTLPINPDALPTNLPALLNVCIEYLIGMRRLPERKSQTNHEFLSYLQTRNDAAVPQFNALCRQAERVLYGGQHPDSSVVKRCRSEAKSLLFAVTSEESTP